MATPPDFVSGAVLTAAQMNAIGLWLVKSQTIGTAVSTVTVTNAFTSDFNAYRIVISNVTMSSTAVGTNFFIKMHDGTNPVNTNYNYGLARIDLAATTVAGVAAALGTNGVVVGQGTGSLFSTTFDILLPNVAAHTLFMNIGFINASTGYAATCTGMHQSATAYTAFQILPSTGTLTGGTINVYGYRA